jgi:autotransporter-associated beta strand protein
MAVGANTTLGTETDFNILSNGTVTLDTVGPDTTLTINGPVEGGGTIVKTGAGQLVLNGETAGFTGAIVVKDGNLVAGNASTLGRGKVVLQGTGSGYLLNGNGVHDGDSLTISPNPLSSKNTYASATQATGSGLMRASSGFPNDLTNNPSTHKISAKSLATAEELIKKIGAILPGDWSVGWSKDPHLTDVIVVECANPLASYFISTTPPTVKNYHLELRVRDFIEPAQAAQWTRENADTESKLEAMAGSMKDLEYVMMPNGKAYISKTPEEKTRVEAYEALQAKMRDVPDYFYGDISLDWTDGSFTYARVTTLDTSTADKEYQDVAAKVKDLLTPYGQ